MKEKVSAEDRVREIRRKTRKKYSSEEKVRMDAGIFDLAAYSRAALQLDIHELMDPKLHKPILQCDREFPHKCEVSGGEMKGSWEEVDKSQTAN